MCNEYSPYLGLKKFFEPMGHFLRFCCIRKPHKKTVFTPLKPILTSTNARATGLVNVACAMGSLGGLLEGLTGGLTGPGKPLFAPLLSNINHSYRISIRLVVASFLGVRL